MSEEAEDVELKASILVRLANLACEPSHATVQPAEAAALRARLNALTGLAGLRAELDCTICIEPLEGGPPVRVLRCRHQFHSSCLLTWWRTQAHVVPALQEVTRHARF